ncbi:hypothetical protein [uncultured Algimonas sp.]|uniref:hypothetical protein n=1 Tax=uncultured Algimonas sp. TaxID=1547920 RepID=UPI002603A6D0|nr:hypothetical protein [uncultured Algimonas sp.]
MSVIARKIALANRPASDHPDAADVADALLEQLKPALAEWLSADYIDAEILRADWSAPDPDLFNGPLMGCQGKQRSQRAVMSVNAALAERAALDLLRISGDPTEEDRASLRPFFRENLFAFGAVLNETQLGRAAGAPDWQALEPDEAQADLVAYETVWFEARLQDGGNEDLRIAVVLSADLFGAAKLDGDMPTVPQVSGKPPSLESCHVRIRAVGDRLEMSVADCTRLAIGQVVGLPGLRFDKLELDVEMGDGPLPLTDAALGADKGRKAVRLNRGLDPDFRVRPPGISADVALPRTAPA